MSRATGLRKTVRHNPLHPLGLHRKTFSNGSIHSWPAPRSCRVVGQSGAGHGSGLADHGCVRRLRAEDHSAQAPRPADADQPDEDMSHITWHTTIVPSSPSRQPEQTWRGPRPRSLSLSRAATQTVAVDDDRGGPIHSPSDSLLQIRREEAAGSADHQPPHVVRCSGSLGGQSSHTRPSTCSDSSL